MTERLDPSSLPATIADEFTSENRGSMHQYFRELGQYPLLTADEERELGARSHAGDEDAIAELVEHNLRFVISVAKKYQHRGVPLADLIGEGNVGLLTGARRFDPAQGVRFVSYAVWWIRQSILSAVSTQRSLVRVPTSRAAALARINRTGDALRQELLREPSLKEIAEASGVPAELIRTACTRGAREVSFDEPVGNDAPHTLLDRCAAEEPGDADEDTSVRLSAAMEKALGELPERDARILRLHFGLEDGSAHTLEEIGERLGVTRERVRQLRDRALRRVRGGNMAHELRVLAGAQPDTRQSSGAGDVPRQFRAQWRGRLLRWSRTGENGSQCSK
jgi:RNA polymerase primary sigma factor